VRELKTIDVAERRRLRGLLFDLDDTLLEHGKLTKEAFETLCWLRDAGVSLIGVTGRPVAWARVLTPMWPVDALVAENGALSVIREGGRPVVDDRLDGPTRAARRSRLLEIIDRLRARCPGLERSDDCDGRVSDYTFDIGEFRSAGKDLVAQALAAAAALGARTTVSSVHLHVTLDHDDKSTGTLRLLAKRFGVDPGRARFEFAYVGDSSNDAPCFGAFRTSVGVSNLRGRFSLPPRFVTEGARSTGFVETAHCLFGDRY